MTFSVPGEKNDWRSPAWPLLRVILVGLGLAPAKPSPARAHQEPSPPGLPIFFPPYLSQKSATLPHFEPFPTAVPRQKKIDIGPAWPSSGPALAPGHPLQAMPGLARPQPQLWTGDPNNLFSSVPFVAPLCYTIRD